MFVCRSLSISLPSGSSLKLSLKNVFEDLKIKGEAEQKKPRYDSAANGSLAAGWRWCLSRAVTPSSPLCYYRVTMAMLIGCLSHAAPVGEGPHTEKLP